MRKIKKTIKLEQTVEKKRKKKEEHFEKGQRKIKTKMEFLSVVLIIFMIILGIANVSIEAYHLINKTKKYLRAELYRAQRNANRFNNGRRVIGFRARFNRNNLRRFANDFGV